SGTITKRMQRNSFIHIMLSIFFCSLLAMLRNFHDTIPRQEVHATNASFHVPNSPSGKFSTLTRIFNHYWFPPSSLYLQDESFCNSHTARFVNKEVALKPLFLFHRELLAVGKHS